MTNHFSSQNHDPGSEQDPELSTQDLLVIWQHFANIGGHDKDRMVAIMTLLTPILTGIIGFAYSSDDPDSRKAAAIAGLVTALVAVVVVLMYAGYANRNWELADEIAETYLANVKLGGIRSPQTSLARLLKPRRLYDYGQLGWLAKEIARGLSLPHHPGKSLAPIFALFLGLAVALAIVSFALLQGWLP